MRRHLCAKADLLPRKAQGVVRQLRLEPQITCSGDPHLQGKPRIILQAKLDLWNVESRVVNDAASEQAVLKIEEDFISTDVLKSMDYQWVAPCLANVTQDEAVVEGVFELRPREIQQSLDQIVSRANGYIAMIDQARKKGTHKRALLHRTGLLDKALSLRK